jgi:hypothetical protein
MKHPFNLLESNLTTLPSLKTLADRLVSPFLNITNRLFSPALPMLSLLLLGLIFLSQSCKPEDEPCPMKECNTGIQNEETCDCDCPENYTGIDCSTFNPERVQALLDAGQTPLTLFDGGIPLDSLYGKLYQGGYLFYLNTDDGTGLVAATIDQGVEVSWWTGFSEDLVALNNVVECADDCLPPEPTETSEGARIGDGIVNTDIIAMAYEADSIAATLCRSLGDEWFLPSREELYLMFVNLRSNKEQGGFAPVRYWSSTEEDRYNAWRQHFGTGEQSSFAKFSEGRVRAVKTF